MSELMRKFLTAYIEWVDAGAPEDGPFSRSSGLCDNTYGLPGGGKDVRNELREMFESDGLATSYPFGEAEFNRDCDHDEQHLHQPRIDWIKSKLAA
jgi:hypothetical protein